MKKLCPKCNVELAFGNVCPECEGCLTGIAVLRTICPEGFLNTCFAEVKQHGKPSVRNCPECTNAMTAVTLPASAQSVELDFCLSCLSIWFDSGEIKKLPKKSEQEKALWLDLQMRNDRVSLDKYYSEQLAKQSRDEDLNAVILVAHSILISK